MGHAQPVVTSDTLLGSMASMAATVPRTLHNNANMV